MTEHPTETEAPCYNLPFQPVKQASKLVAVWSIILEEQLIVEQTRERDSQ